MNKCKKCGALLVNCEKIHVLDGELYCSDTCAMDTLIDEYIQNAKEFAKEAYNERVEVVAASDILDEDLQDVRVIQTRVHTIKVPKNLSETEAICEAARLVEDGIITMSTIWCDKCTTSYRLVKNDNSSDEEVQ